MKSSSHNKPKSILPVAPGEWHINYNISESSDPETGKLVFEFEYVKVSSLDKNTAINAVVRKQYSESEELAILRKHAAGNDHGQFEAYNVFVENAKSIIKTIFDEN